MVLQTHRHQQLLLHRQRQRQELRRRWSVGTCTNLRLFNSPVHVSSRVVDRAAATYIQTVRHPLCTRALALPRH